MRSMTGFVVVAALSAIGLAPLMAQAPHGGAAAGARRTRSSDPAVAYDVNGLEDGGVIPDNSPRRPVRWRCLRNSNGRRCPRHTELRAAASRSRARPQQGFEDGHHALADLEHPRDGDGSSGRRRARRVAGRQPSGQPSDKRLHGPGRPAGPYHHYTFELYALDTKLDVPQGTPQQAADTRIAVINAMDGHVLGKALLVARFHR